MDLKVQTTSVSKTPLKFDSYEIWTRDALIVCKCTSTKNVVTSGNFEKMANMC